MPATNVIRMFNPADAPTPSGANRWLYSPPGEHPLRPGSLLRRRLEADTQLYQGSANEEVAPSQADEFLSICRSSLWGSEDLREFGELLYGLLETFRPRNRWDLELLANVADAQWKIRRIRRLQQGVYNQGPEGRDAMGVSQRTHNASSFSEDLLSLQAQLDQALKTFKRSRA